MPVSKGIDVQKSRFAALALETSSESEEEPAAGEWQTVKKGATAGSGGGKKRGGAQSTGQDGGENKPLSKNAKKRARKKRQQQQAQMASETASPGGECRIAGQVEPGQPVKAAEPLWQKKNEQVMEQEFQKDLEQAILLSKLEAEKQDKLDHQIQATEQLLKATKPPSKKKITMSLQQLHMEKAPAKADSAPHLSDNSDPTLSPVDPEFFSRLGQDVKTELKREKDIERRVHIHVDGNQPQSPSSVTDDLPRIAQLQNEIEKRDKALLQSKKENDALKKALKEVKERNQSLCMIMSQGEISSKAKLLQQIQELTTVKNDLTSEVETLHASLEQERSKNKTLKSELAKIQGIKGAKSM